MRLLSVLFLFSILCCDLIALSDEDKGLAIAMDADKKDTGWGDASANMTMILKNKQGQESRRSIRIKMLEVLGDGDKSLTVFDSPKDIKGTAFLSHTHSLTADDQWLFLPALKRVKRIASANKSGPFVGSEFAYEDLTSQEVEKYTYKWLRDEKTPQAKYFVIEAYPAYQYSGYTKQIVWVDSDMYQPMKIEFYDRKGALLKTLTYSGMRQYLSQYWRADRMYMENHQTGKTTELLWNNWAFKTGLVDRDFEKNTLKRTR